MSDTNQTGFDPGREHLGEVYAQALLGATEKAGVTETVVAELGSFVEDVLDKLPQIRATLFSLRVKSQEKEALLDKGFSGKMSPQLLNFLKVLARHNRLDAVRQVWRSAQQQLNKLRGRVEVFVTSATPIPADKLELVKAKIGQIKELRGKDLVLHMKVDPELLGGIKVRVGDKLFDSTLATQLQRMKDVALDHTEQQIRRSMDRFVSSGGKT